VPLKRKLIRQLTQQTQQKTVNWVAALYEKFVALKVLQWLNFLNQVLKIKWLQTQRLLDS